MYMYFLPCSHIAVDWIHGHGSESRIYNRPGPACCPQIRIVFAHPDHGRRCVHSIVVTSSRYHAKKAPAFLRMVTSA